VILGFHHSVNEIFTLWDEQNMQVSKLIFGQGGEQQYHKFCLELPKKLGPNCIMSFFPTVNWKLHMKVAKDNFFPHGPHQDPTICAKIRSECAWQNFILLTTRKEKIQCAYFYQHLQ
jgi:hypothetical protein